MKELFCHDGEYFILSDGKPFASGVFSPESVKVGDVFAAKAREQEASIGATFFDIGDKRTAFLASTKYKTGSMRLLQVKTEPHDGKGAELTDKISFSGKYCVATFSENENNAENKIEFSKKITDESVKSRVLGEIGPLSRVSSYGISVKVRSAFSLDDLASLKDEIRKFSDEFKSIADEPKIKVKRLKSLNFSEYLNKKYRIPEFSSYHFEKPLDFYSEYSKIKRLFESKVYLKSGGWLTVEKTEAMYVIDVNSGSSKKKALELNIEALEAIHEAVRVRNIAGIIIIDFVNMSKEDEKILAAEFGKYCAEDYSFFKPLGFTRLGLFEAERKRT